MRGRSREDLLAFLVESGAGNVAHTGRTFLDHLIGVEGLLADWGCDEDVQSAGLFHSVYGTNRFKTALVGLHTRPLVTQLIGKEAEELAFLFCSSTRPQAWLDACAGGKLVDRQSGKTRVVSKAVLGRLIEMECANLLEQDNGRKFLQAIPSVTHKSGVRLRVQIVDAIRARLAPAEDNHDTDHITIETAQTGDLPEILALAHQLHVDSRYASLRFDEQSTKRFLAATIGNSRACILVARTNGEARGFLQGALHEVPWSNSRIAKCEHIYVAPRQRGLTGLRLLHMFKRWARTAGAIELRVIDTFGEDVRRSRAYFERVGLGDTGGSFSLWL